MSHFTGGCPYPHDQLWKRIKEQDAKLDLHDTFFDDAFTNDPFMKGALDAEWEAHNGRSTQDGES